MLLEGLREGIFEGFLQLFLQTCLEISERFRAVDLLRQECNAVA